MEGQTVLAYQEMVQTLESQTIELLFNKSDWCTEIKSVMVQVLANEHPLLFHNHNPYNTQVWK